MAEIKKEPENRRDGQRRRSSLPVLGDDLSSPARRLIEGREHRPHALLGRLAQQLGVRVWLPEAVTVCLEPHARVMRRVHPAGLFEWCAAGVEDAAAVDAAAVDAAAVVSDQRYRVRWQDAAGVEHLTDDPYAFALTLDADLLRGFSDGSEIRAWRLLGAHCMEIDGVAGTRFSVWAPNAERVSVIGDFNGWNGLRHPMTVHGSSGVWELFLPGVGAGSLYKFELRSRDTGEVVAKIDPFARRLELPPRTACIVTADSDHAWADQAWMEAVPGWQHAPMSIYEIHPGSWRRHADGRCLSYRELADALVAELDVLGFTHVELMPVTEHPFSGSWGYQTTGYFASTARFGGPDDLRYLVDTLHQHGIGVILDWVPGHFPRDAHALARFDGTALFEHADPRRGETAEWNTLAFNFGRNEVRSFLISSALYWLELFHLDGLRIDAVAAMLYLDYGRRAGEWVPNIHGGNENLEAVSFLQDLNRVTHRECPASFTIAEESTAWPAVTRPVHLGGLGFSMKWNMGWMHDTLVYMRQDPVHRRYHHDALTFGLLYAHRENFVLPLSHDEVVHGKGSLLAKMPGDRWQQFANLRLLYTYMYGYPGKKLLFMGSEVGVPQEWSHEQQAIPAGLEHDPLHAGVRRLLADLNRAYRCWPALHAEDFLSVGFEWIDCHDADQSVISFLRRGNGELMVVACNFTPVPRHGYRLGLPVGGTYQEVLNSDAAIYGGSNQGNLGTVVAEPVSWMGRPFSARLTLPPLAAVLLAVPGQ